jgi:hypothetical protein
MHYSDVIRYGSGLLQFGVAFYALRLGRLFSTARVGWLLFSGLAILALANLLLPLNPFRSSIQMGVKIDIIYALVSGLLIAGMVHFDLRFRKRQNAESSERDSQVQWEAQAQRRFETATKTSEELRAIANKLQAEIAQQKQTQEQAELSHQEQLAGATQTETELRQTISRLETELADQKRLQEETRVRTDQAYQEQLNAARQDSLNTATAAATTRVFEQLAPLLEHALAAAQSLDDLSKARLAPLTRIARLLNEQARDIGHFAKAQVRLRPIPDRLVQLAQQLAEEQGQHLKKLDGLKRRFALIKDSVVQNHNELATVLGLESIAAPTGELVSLRLGIPTPASAHLDDLASPPAEPAPQPAAMGDLQNHLINNVTQTATELPPQDQAPIPPESTPASAATAPEPEPASASPSTPLKLKMA